MTFLITLFLNVIRMNLLGTFHYILLKLMRKRVEQKISKHWLFYSWLFVLFGFMMIYSPNLKSDESLLFADAKSDMLINYTNEAEKNDNIILPGSYENIGCLDEQMIDYDEVNNSHYIVYQLLEAVTLVWLVGMMFLILLRIKVRVHYCRQLKKSIQPDCVDSMCRNLYEMQLQREASNCELNSLPAIKWSTMVENPMLFGITRPCIYLPFQYEQCERMDMVLRHELIHYKRHDLIYKELTSIVKIIHWFNPIIWRVEKAIDRECELSCDERIISNMSFDEKKQYMMVILNSAFYTKRKEQLVMANLNKSDGPIEERIYEILNAKKRKTYKALSMGVAVFIMSGCLTSSVMGMTMNHMVEHIAQDNHLVVMARSNKKLKTEKKYQLSNYNTPHNLDDASSAITYYINNPTKVSQEELDAVFYDYVKNTMDIGHVFNVIDYLSTKGIDKIADYYLTQSGNYGLYNNFKNYLSKEMDAKLKKQAEAHIHSAKIETVNANQQSGISRKEKNGGKTVKVRKDRVNDFCETGGTYIDEYVDHPEKYSQKELDAVFVKFIKETHDVAQVFNVIDHLSKGAIAEIARIYMTDTGDWGMYYSFKDYLTKESQDQLGALAQVKINGGNQLIDKPTAQLANYNIPQKTKDPASAITYYCYHPTAVSQEELGNIFYDYVKNTMDVGQTFNVINYLSKDKISEIAELYMRESQDWGMYYSFKPYLTKQSQEKLGKLAEENLKANNRWQ